MTKTKPTFRSWAAPSAEDEALWASLSREEQIEALRERLGATADQTLSERSVDEILEETLAHHRGDGAKL